MVRRIFFIAVSIMLVLSVIGVLSYSGGAVPDAQTFKPLTFKYFIDTLSQLDIKPQVLLRANELLDMMLAWAQPGFNPLDILGWLSAIYAMFALPFELLFYTIFDVLTLLNALFTIFFRLIYIL